MKYVLLTLTLVISFAHTSAALASTCEPALDALAPLFHFEGDEVAYKDKEALYNFLSGSGVLPSKSFYMAVAETLDPTALKNLDGMMGNIDLESLMTKATAILDKMITTNANFIGHITFVDGKARAKIEGIAFLKAEAKRAHLNFTTFINSVEVLKQININPEIKKAVTDLIAETLPYFAKSAFYKAKAFRLEDKNSVGWLHLRDNFYQPGDVYLEPMAVVLAPVYMPFVGVYMTVTHTMRNTGKIYNKLRGKQDVSNPFRKNEATTEPEDRSND